MLVHHAAEDVWGELVLQQVPQEVPLMRAPRPSVSQSGWDPLALLCDHFASPVARRVQMVLPPASGKPPDRK